METNLRQAWLTQQDITYGCLFVFLATLDWKHLLGDGELAEFTQRVFYKFTANLLDRIIVIL